MKRYGWYASLGIVATGALGGSAACTVTTTSSTGDDSGIVTLPDASHDGGSTPDSGGGTPDSGTADANFCEPTDSSSSCETCLLQNCCAEEEKCGSEPVDDATGNTDCQDIASCFNDCIQPPPGSGVEAGTPADCTTTCVAGHTAQGTTDFKALATCGNTHCPTQCM
jgi:hypothetical protein